MTASGLTSLCAVFFVGFVGATAKELVELIKNADCIIRFRLWLFMSATSGEMKLMNSMLVPHPEITNKLWTAMNCKVGGITIFAAPQGAGKSTYICSVVRKYIQETSAPVVYISSGANALEEGGLHKLFGIPRSRPISSYIPEGTVVVIDQFDIRLAHIDHRMQSYIVELAANSRNTKAYSIIICVSFPDVFRAMLKFNNGEKIRRLCPPQTAMWSRDQMKDFIDSKYQRWSENDRISLLDLFAMARSPGPIWSAAQFSLEGDIHDFDSIPQSVLEEIKQSVDEQAKLWDAFTDRSEKSRRSDSMNLLMPWTRWM
jgi:hypothetical protein